MVEVKVLASGSSGNCYLINDGRTKILLEAGIPIKKIREATGFQLSQVSGALISHCHL
jgi:phosphoribosyl 1,2-cyclic phosphodiesterase